MLRLAFHILTESGFLFLAVRTFYSLLVGGIKYPYGQLPLACVANSRYLDFDHLKALMETIGFREVQQRWRPGGKMAYWLYRKELPLHGVVEQFQTKVVLRQGNRNNFSILL